MSPSDPVLLYLLLCDLLCYYQWHCVIENIIDCCCYCHCYYLLFMTLFDEELEYLFGRMTDDPSVLSEAAVLLFSIYCCGIVFDQYYCETPIY